MRTLRVLRLSLCTALLCTALGTGVRADTWNKKTIVTFNESVEIPGQVLPAGLMCSSWPIHPATVTSCRSGTKMRPKSSSAKRPAEQVVKDIRRATRRHFSAEDKIRIVLEGLRGDDSIAELCRKEGIAQSLFYTWSKEFMEAGKRRLAGDTARAATTDEVKDLRREASALKECVADLTLENRLLKKSMIADGGDDA